MHQTKTYFTPLTRTDRVHGDGVGVLGAGGRGDHGTSTSASRAATQLDFLGGQRRYGRLRCSGTRDLASVPPPKPSSTSKMARAGQSYAHVEHNCSSQSPSRSNLRRPWPNLQERHGLSAQPDPQTCCPAVSQQRAWPQSPLRRPQLPQLQQCVAQLRT